MKQVTAFFKVNHKVGSVIDTTVYGKVKFKNEKLSISIENRNYIRCVSLVESTVRKEFQSYKTSEIFYDIIETSDNLVNELRDATQDLKKDYIKKTIETSERIYKNAESRLPEVIEMKKNAFNEYRIDNKNSKAKYEYKEYAKLMEKFSTIVGKGYDKFLKQELDHAEFHYESSLLKLAERLIIKGITGDYTIKSGYVGVNFEVTIEGEKGTVRAWTIIAEGPIVRAHYRYLVK
jgi:hypothetical protein